MFKSQVIDALVNFFACEFNKAAEMATKYIELILEAKVSRISAKEVAEMIATEESVPAK